MNSSLAGLTCLRYAYEWINDCRRQRQAEDEQDVRVGRDEGARGRTTSLRQRRSVNAHDAGLMTG